jgi:type VII secretion protein EccE
MRMAPVVAVEAALLVAPAAAGAGLPLWSALVLAAAAVAAATVRVRGRWGVDLVRVWVRYRIRARRAAEVVTPPVVVAHTDRSAATFGVRTHDAALDMVLAVDTAGAQLPWTLLVAALGDHDVRLDSVRVLTAYRRATVDREVRVVLRLRPADCPAAVLARGGGAPGARRALSAAATRLVRRLTDHGLPTRVLGPREVAELSYGAVAEKWDHCVVGASRHVLYRLTRWPADGQPFLAALHERRCAEVVTALSVSPAERGFRLTGTVRMTDPDPAGAAAVTGPPGVRWTRLDGEHAEAFALTTAGCPGTDAR